MWEQTICVTNRHLAAHPYLTQLERAIAREPHALILREKDISEEAYRGLLEKVKDMCEGTEVLLIPHTYLDAALDCGIHHIHLPMRKFLALTDEQRAAFDMIGVSTHTVEEAIAAEKLGADYVITSHIFPTDCKMGVPPRGLTHLHDVCEAVSIPVYALGGIHPDNADLCFEQGAAGVAMMSEYMRL